MEKLSSPDQPGKFEALSFAYQSAKSLLYNIPDRVGVIYRPIYDENANTPECLPLNTEEEVLSTVSEVVRQRDSLPRIDFRPYWNKAQRYNAAEVFGATVQSVDLHDAPLPKTVLPPEEDISAFIESVKSLPQKARVAEQLTIALNIADDDLLGAVNICWIATRFMARGADQRAYPNISMDATKVRDWNDQLAQFETYNNADKNDAPGDNYYFWTHAVGAMVFSKKGMSEAMAQLAFGRGTQIMAFVRKNIAKGDQPNITAHAPASEIGREVGLLLASLDESTLAGSELSDAM
jgi:hypothetical protein